MVAVREGKKKLVDWDKRALQVEVKLLERELEHLSMKQSQRRLSYWEESRLRQIPTDISSMRESVDSLD